MTGDPAHVVPDNPFPGFRPFEEREAPLFFGRREPTFELLERLATTSFVAVVGVSGSGKSSLVRCGVLPALHRGLLGRVGSRWTVAQLRPRNDPIGELAKALADAQVLGPRGGPTVVETVLRRSSFGLVDLRGQSELDPHENLLIVVDQFEELFRFKASIEQRRSEEEAAAFVKLLLEAADLSRHKLEVFHRESARFQRERAELDRAEQEGDEGPQAPDAPAGMVYVMITLRSDFLGDCSGFRDLAHWINDGLFLVPLMTRDQRREAIEGPIARRGEAITPRLANRMLNDAGDDPTGLPLLQHALMRTWQEWADRRRQAVPVADCDESTIDLCDYEAGGGIAGALDQHLNGIFDSLSPLRQEVVKRLFQRLTVVTTEGQAVRRPATFGELCEQIGAASQCAPDDVRAVIEAFRAEGRTFLMPPLGTPLEEDTLVDISHESLIPSWGKLRGWVDEEAESARIYVRLAQTAFEWGDRRKREHSAYEDPELERALEWREREKPSALWARPYDERLGLEFDQATDFLDWSKSKRTQVRVLLGAAAIAVFAGVSVTAIVQTNRAARNARAQQIEFAGTRPDPLDGLLLLTEMEGQDDVDGRGAEIALALAGEAIPFAVPDRHSSAIRQLAFDQTGERLVALDEDGAVRMYDVASGADLELPAFVDSVGDRVADLFYAGDSHFALFVRGDEDSSPSLRTASGQSITIPPGRDFSLFSPDGSRFMAVYTEAGVVCVWKTGLSAGDNDSACAAALAPVSAQAASATPPDCQAPPSSAGDTPEVVLRHRDVETARFSLDGARLVSRSSAGGGLCAWDLESGTVLGRIGDIQVADFAISNDDSPGHLLTAHRSPRVARVWDLPGDGSVVSDPRCELYHDGAVDAVSFAGSGHVLTVSDDRIARLWDPKQAACAGAESSEWPLPRSSLAGHDAPIHAAFISGSLVMTVSRADATVRLWDGDNGELKQILRGVIARALAVDRAGRLIATGDNEGEVRIYGTTTAPWFTRLPPQRGEADGPDAAGDIYGIAVGPDGSWIATGHTDSTVRRWDPLGNGIGEPFRLPDAPALLAHGPGGRGGRLAAAVCREGVCDRVVIWSLGRNEPDAVVPDAVADASSHTLGNIRALAFNDDGSLLLTGDEDGWVRGWNARSGAPSGSVQFGEIVTAVASHDDVTAAGSSDGRVRLWASGGTEDGFEKKFKTEISSLAFGPDGRKLAVAAPGDDTVLVWSLREETTSWSESQFEDPLILPGARFVRFVHDDALLTVDADQIRIWDASSGDELHAARIGTGAAPDGSSNTEGAAGDGSVFARNYEDGTVRIWPLTWQRGLLQALRERVTRACLESTDRVRLLGEKPEQADAAEMDCRRKHQAPATDGG